MDRPRVVRRGELRDAGQTPGMVRQVAFEDGGVWVGLARTDADVVSGWHHHGDHATYVYCVAGALRVESGPGGLDGVDAGAGDFVAIPANTVHRESNPSAEESVLVVVRVGTGPVVVNVDGPDAG